MSGVRAQWHLAEMADEDPFGDVVYSTGLTLDLTGTEEELAAQFAALLLREGRLAAAGVECDLKASGQDCLHCPMATLDPNQTRSVLCRLGKDQRTVEHRFEERRSKRLAPVRELASQIEGAAEVGALDDELAELLTAVGL